METRASHILVGLFVVVLTLATAGFGLWLGRVALDRAVDVYDVVFRSAVTGLPNGAQVTYQGVPVGRVTDIRFGGDGLEQVIVRIEVDPETPVTTDTGAQLAPQGITGVFFVQLIPGSEGSEPLRTSGGDPARIVATPSALERLFADFPEILAQGVILLERAVELLDDDNVQSISGTLANLNELSGTLADRREDVDRLIVETTDLVADLRVAAAGLERVMATVETTVDEAGAALPDLLVQGATTLEEVDRVARRMGAVADQLDGLLREVRQPMRDFAQGGLYEFNALIGETRLLVAAATRISREFERDPAGFL
ncbi:MAG: MlaD family protein, partial [Pseudomonadota bacterium]